MIYSSLAPQYDALMSHVDYREWLQFIEKVVKKFFLHKRISIFEIGAGTGNLGKLLINAGYEYGGSDASFNMCIEANKKKHHFCCADARMLPVKKSFDLIIFLYDGINYLSSLQEYGLVFDSIYNALSENGLFLFDITTEFNSIQYFLDYQYYEETEQVSLVRHSYFTAHDHSQHNDFVFFFPQKNGPFFEKKTEHHIQKLFSPSQIARFIPKNKFSCMGIYDGFTFKKYNPESERIHFLLKKL